ncbi:MAG: retropepsin-like aspartic protease family protein [Rhodoferax sp.]
MARALLMFLLSLALGLAHAQSVGFSGVLGAKALLIVDGAPPKAVGAGETHKGVKVVSVQPDSTVIEVSGQRQTLRLGDAPAHVGVAPTGQGAGTRIVLTAGPGGHFVTTGQINGKSIQMVVDTGATGVSISESDAQRIGLDYRQGKPVRLSTANGTVSAWHVKLASVRVGEVTVHDVDGVVSPGHMPMVLLGNSFLGRFSMTRTNDTMVLERRY